MGSCRRAADEKVNSVDSRRDNPGMYVSNAQSSNQGGVNSLKPSLRSLLLAVFALVGVVLAAIGIYSVISYTVGQRTHEIGIRAALGASRGDLLRLILPSGMLMASIG